MLLRFLEDWGIFEANKFKVDICYCFRLVKILDTQGYTRNKVTLRLYLAAGYISESFIFIACES